MRRKITVQVEIEADVEPDYTAQRAAEFIQGVLWDKIGSAAGRDALINVTPVESRETP